MGAPEDPSDAYRRTNPSQPLELRSFGRRKGRALSARQQRLMATLLPRLQLDLTKSPSQDLGALFDPSPDQIWLEIGFGGAEHLLWQARHNDAVGLIGCEPFADGVAKALAGIEERSLTNIRLHPDDARDFVRWLPSVSIDRVFILFPDPWPKRRHVKRRLVNKDLVAALARVMRPGAELRIATDIADYLRTILIAFSAQTDFAWRCEGPSDWRRRAGDWPATRYEMKALREGRRCYYLSFVRSRKER